MKHDDFYYDYFQEAVNVIVHIECTECNAVYGSEDEFGAYKEFYKLGWRTDQDGVYCKKCAKHGHKHRHDVQVKVVRKNKSKQKPKN